MSLRHKVSSAPSTPGSLTPAPLQKAPEPEPMPVPVAAPVEPAKKPSKHVQRSKKAPPAKKAARAGLLEAVEADVRAARAAPAPKPAPSAEPPKPAVRAAREPA